ncbi:unnamed protein product [Peniophora sp. CBMAI 1063]|nr:unnamed protein product [Peniophora sp. CBMAI 1063]
MATTIEAATIDSLPNEVLLIIFHWIKVDDLKGDDYHGPPRCAYLSHVSQRWRRLAIAYSQLWDHWPRYDTALAWTETCCERSANTSLALCFVVTSQATQRMTEAMNLAAARISRAKVISVSPGPANSYGHLYIFSGDTSAGSQPILRSLSTLSFDDAPLLESISLKNAHGMVLLAPQATINLFSVPQPPRLQRLSIRGYSVSLSNSIQLDTLRNLDIHNASAWRTIDEMIDVLKKVPNIEELNYMYNSSEIMIRHELDRPPTSPSTTHHIRCVDLPRLRRLILPRTGEFKPAAMIFIYCSLAPRTALCLEADEVYDDWGAHKDLYARALRHHFSAAIAANQSYDIVSLDDRIIKPDISRQTSPSTTLPSELSFSILHAQHNAAHSENVLESSCKLYFSLPIFAGTHELHVARDRQHCYTFLDHLPAMPAVRTLVLQGDAVMDFTAGYLASCGTRFPELEVLRLADFDCHDTAGSIPFSEVRTITADSVVEALTEAWSTSEMVTWRTLEFERFRYADYIAECIRKEPELRAFNERVEIRCIDCYE